MIKKIQMLCVIILFAIVPLIIWLSHYWYVSPIFSTTFEIATHYTTELYAKAKWIVFLIVSFIFLVTTVYDVWRNKKVHNKGMTVLVSVAALCFLVSSLLSSESYTALLGVGNRYDGALTYIACLAVLWSMIHSQVTISLKQLVFMSIPFTVINITLQFLLAFELDTPIAKVGATVANANVASAMFAMIAVLVYGYQQVSKVKSVLILVCLNIVGVLLTTSMVGFILLLVGIAAVTIITKGWKTSGLVVVISFLLAISLNTLNERIVEESFGIFMSEQTSLDSRLQTKLEEPVNKEVGYNDGYPILPAINTTALSSREYIWEKTTSLIVERPLLGYGMDTLRIHFPHFNEDARAGISSPGIIVDKAHSMYVGLLYGTGIFTVLSLVSVVFYCVRKIRWHSLSINEKILIVVVMLFFMQGMTNDLYMGLNTFAVVLIGVLLQNVYRPSN